MTALRQHFGQQALTLHVAFYNQRLHLVFSVINASFTARNSCPIFPGNRSASTAVFSQPAAFKFAGALRRDGKVNSPQLPNPPPRDLRSIAHSFQLAQGRLFIRFILPVSETAIRCQHRLAHKSETPRPGSVHPIKVRTDDSTKRSPAPLHFAFVTNRRCISIFDSSGLRRQTSQNTVPFSGVNPLPPASSLRNQGIGPTAA